jgi:hypothetical protein
MVKSLFAPVMPCVVSLTDTGVAHPTLERDRAATLTELTLNGRPRRINVLKHRLAVTAYVASGLELSDVG